MKVLITGGSSLLGSYLFHSVPEDIEADFTWYTNRQPWTFHQLDVCNKSQVGYVFSKVKPDYVVHMAAIGDVDWCERNYTEAERVIVSGTMNVAMSAKEVGARVLLTSTNAVYSGTNPPYNEDSERHPINVYGRLRERAENIVLKRDGQIVRLFLLYGWEPPGARDNWGSSFIRKLERGKSLRLVDDIYYMPTYAGDAARAIWKVLELGESLNVAGQDRVSVYEFGMTLAQVFNADENRIQPIRFSDLDITQRPIDSSYDLAKSKNLGVCCRGIREGLKVMKDDRIRRYGIGI